MKIPYTLQSNLDRDRERQQQSINQRVIEVALLDAFEIIGQDFIYVHMAFIFVLWSRPPPH